MKKLILILFVFINSLAYSQDFSFKGHTIKVESVESYEVLDTYTSTLEEYPVAFEKNLRKIKEIKTSNSEFKEDIAKLENGTIYLNYRLEKYPNIKKAVILHYLLVTNGFEPIETPFVHILNTDIHISRGNESYFKKIFRNNLVYSWVVRESKKVAPLNSRL